jgi:hypothetical protein
MLSPGSRVSGLNWVKLMLSIALGVKAAGLLLAAQGDAVDNTFAQFYPTLFEIAKRRGTLKAVAEEKAPAGAHREPAK